jgi:hypothetical protein
MLDWISLKQMQVAANRRKCGKGGFYIPRHKAETAPCRGKIETDHALKISGSRPISRVLSWTIIHLGLPSPAASSNLPESTAGHGIAFLFGLAPGGVYLAAECCHLRGALLPHHFTLTSEEAVYFLLHFP